MGFRSTFVTEDYQLPWPEWFTAKYAQSVWFPSSMYSGPIASSREDKTYGDWYELGDDIRRAIDWQEYGLPNFVVVFLHECGGITRCEITAERVRWSEPQGWQETDGVTHSYCYKCSDLPASGALP